MNKNKKPELLVPIQDYMSLKIAIENGADAVYFGIRGFNMRENAKNFTVNDLPKIAKIAKKNKIKTYLAINTIIYEEELKKIETVLRKVKRAGIDAIICWDFAIIEIAKKIKLETHLSTQASVANSMSAEFFRKLGIKRIVLARECSIEQIKKIKKKTKVEIEIFIHGAMCISISGRCFMSEFLYNKSANRGECLQPCRRKYIIKQIDGEKEMELGENYILSPKDLCTMDFIEKIIDLNIDCLKIEGRNRSPEYVAVTTKSYRTIIDYIYNAQLSGVSKKNLEQLKSELKKDLEKVYNRGFGSGFLLGKPVGQATNSYGSQATEKKVHVGEVSHFFKKIGVAEIMIQANKKIKLGDEIVFQGNSTGLYKQKIESMQIKHKPITIAKQGDKIAIKVSSPVHPNDQVYMITSV